jgi:hypothetical protein
MGRAGRLSPQLANNPECAHVFGQIQAEVLAYRVFIALEEALYKRLVHNSHGRGGLVVGRGEGASAQDGNAKVLKIVCAHPVP